MEDRSHVLVIGAANLDIKGRADRTLVRGSSVPGRIQSSPGGVARNIAENLARLEVNTILLTAVGDDDAGPRLLGQAAASGIDTSEAMVVEQHVTGAYMVLMEPDGSVGKAVDDLSCIAALTPTYFEERAHLFESASMVAVDANLTPEALAKVVQLCQRYQVRLYGDPTSVILAERLRPHLPNLYLVSPNIPETEVLCGERLEALDTEASLSAAKRLVSMGVDITIIARGEYGVVYADAETVGHIPAIQTQIVDPTGAGESLSAAIIFGLLEGIPLDECVRLGVTAASLTLRTHDTVRPDLSIDLLYDELVI